MIKEDYVSFEIAKLLKEKGFSEPVSSVFAVKRKHEKISWFMQSFYVFNENGTKDNYYISAPTVQLVMKWFREIFDINIQISFANTHWCKDGWTCQVYDYHTNPEQPQKHYPNGTAPFSTYELACKAAIKYCLENLI